MSCITLPVKGRDWYDFIWYVARKTQINFELLSNAIVQAGPWKSQKIAVTPQWFLQELKLRIAEIDWKAARQDVARFLKSQGLASLEVWSKEFFDSRLDKLASYLINVIH